MMAEKPRTSYGYQYGSEATKYGAHVHKLPQQTPRYDDTPLKRPRVTPYRKVDWAFGMKLCIGGGVLFAVTFGFVHLCADLSTKQSQLKTINREMREVKSSINNLESVIASSLNLDHIQRQATTQLEMAEPLPHQIVYLEFPKESYTVYNE
ncbi:MAG: hypothetical protein ACRCTE_09820 [Cellulosilyticaceae bacterium]